jgi:hypothetical protein
VEIKIKIKINLSNTKGTESESEDASIAASGNNVYVSWWERDHTSNEPICQSLISAAGRSDAGNSTLDLTKQCGIGGTTAGYGSTTPPPA